MATWKKIIVSGSTANLAALSVDNLTSGSVVIGGGTGNLTTVAINGTGSIVATTAATGLSHSGSFSGSFYGALIGTATTASYVNGNIFTGTNIASSASYATYATSASYVVGGGLTSQSLSNSTGITSFSFNGASAATVAVSGASSLSTNAITKWTGAAFANSSLTDNGTAITGTTSLQLTGANSSLTGSFSGSFYGTSVGTSSYATTSSYALFATSASQAQNSVSSSFAVTTNNITSAITNNVDNYILTAQGTGIINGESNLTFDGTTLNVSGNATVTGNLSVNGTASFNNTQNLLIADQFILLASGSTTLRDGGIIVAQSGISGSALYLSAASTGTFGRFGVASVINASASSATVDEYMVTAKINQGSIPSAAPTWGNSGNGSGNIWTTNTGDIYIYA